MKLFPAKCHERATLRKLWRRMENSSLLPAKCWPLLHVIAGISARFSNFAFVLLYNKSLNDRSLGEQWILFPSNLNVSLDFVSGNIEILGKQNSLFPSGPVIKCLLYSLLLYIPVWSPTCLATSSHASHFCCCLWSPCSTWHKERGTVSQPVPVFPLEPPFFFLL